MLIYFDLKISVAKLIDAEVNDVKEDGEFSDIYHSPKVFKLNYAEMVKKFKVYIYPDGDPNTFYQTPRKLIGKYSSKGYFFFRILETIGFVLKIRIKLISLSFRSRAIRCVARGAP